MTTRNIFPVTPSYCHGDILFLHEKIKNRTNAFEIGEDNQVLLLIPRSVCPLSVWVDWFNEDNSFGGRLDSEYLDSITEYDVFSVSLSSFVPGLYFIRPYISSFLCNYYGYHDLHAMKIEQNAHDADIQITLSDFHKAKKPDIYGGLIYHIFVDRFHKAGRATYHGDYVLNPDWDNGMVEYPSVRGGELKNNMFFGGTLDGIREKLPYLKSLGVTVLYLSPIFESPSNHKYDTADYMKIDEMFGGEAAFSDLLVACRKMGMKILLDGVFNHTGADSKYFNKLGRYDTLGAYQSQESLYYPWYEFQDFPDRYTCWWDIPILPRIHTDKKSCHDFFVGKNGVIETYAKMGILGFRLDVVDELSDDFVRDIRKSLSENGKGTVIYGEVWEDASNKIAYGKRKRYYLGEELDGVMNYPLRRGLLSFFLEGKTDELSYALSDIIENAPRRIRDAQMNFLGTHDTERILSIFAKHKTDGLKNADFATLRLDEKELSIATKRLLAAYTVLATLPGIPSIFYGDEAGLEGYHDPFNRMPFPWGRENKKIQNHYRKIGKIRQSESVYQEGDFHLLALCPSLLIFARTNENSCCLTICNTAICNVSVTFSEVTEDLLQGKKQNKFSVSPLTSKVYRMSKDSFFYIEKSK